MSEGENNNAQSGHHELVVVGSSAGGIEALSMLVSTLPTDFPAPIVLAQHLDPTRPSSLGAILQRRSTLPVEVVSDSSLLEPGKIYVVPSNRHVTIKDDHVELEEDHGNRPRPSVDLLLSTAAAEYGEHLIAVILTGSGSDGAAGAVEVKDAGGTVIVQNPQTSRYPAMALAIPPTVVDFEADVERIGPLIYDLLRGVRLPQPWAKTSDVLRRILEQVSHQAGIDFRSYKTTTILRRISRRMVATHNLTMSDYAQHLEQHPEEIGELVKAFLINVTQFFRDPEAYIYLKNELLPLLIAQARERHRVLRFWSAGCATGEESYSLAMLVADLLGTELSGWSIKIFATDIDESATNFARRGIYSDNLLKGMPAEYRDRFFEWTDRGYHISKMLRQMVIFGQHDLSRSAPFPRIDLIMCRNVLIYFTPELQDYVLNQFAFSLSPNQGYLFLGKAETVRPNHSYYKLVNKQWKVYRCSGDGLPVSRRQVLPELHSRPLQEQLITSRPVRGGDKLLSDIPAQPPSIEIGQVRRLNEVLLRFLPVGVVVIDRSYRIITTNTAARRLLGLRDVINEQDFLHAVRGLPYAEVRSAIDTVFHERNPITLSEVKLDSPMDDGSHYLNLSIVPMQLDAGTPDLAAISVSDVTEQLAIRQQLEATRTEQAEFADELGAANRRLSEMNKELLDANEQLQVANEELVLTHEELQATIEEFETTNEELQATNEELETTNEELQATNEELETTNDELRARTAELQEVITMLEIERARLSQIMELAPFYIMVLRGPNLLVETFNPRYAQLSEGQLVQGRPLAEVFELFWKNGQAVVDLAREVYLKDSMRTTSRMLTYIPDEHGEPLETYFVYTLVPMHDARGQVDGVIIYTADVTEQRARKREEERERLRLIFEHADQVALGLYDAQTAELLMASPLYLDILERADASGRQDFIGSLWHEFDCVAPAEEALEIWQRVLESHTSLQLPEVHTKLVHDDQETIWDWSLTPIMDPEQPDVVRFMLVSAVEITEQVQARQEVERLDHLKDEFLALASHELRTPLTSLIGNTGLIARLLARSEDQRKPEHDQRMNRLVSTMRQQLDRLNRLIEDLVDVGRLQTGKFVLEKEQVNLAEIVQRAVSEAQMAIPQLPIQLSMPEKDEPVYVHGDPGRLIQVVLNLLHNALTYADSERIDVRLSRVRDEASQMDLAQIEVQDYGVGIAPENVDAIFTRFYQVERTHKPARSGLGLGLFISRQIIEQHGGTITVDSRLGEGSTFIVHLPLATS